MREFQFFESIIEKIYFGILHVQIEKYTGGPTICLKITCTRHHVMCTFCFECAH
jgi:hypothetical protein